MKKKRRGELYRAHPYNVIIGLEGFTMSLLLVPYDPIFEPIYEAAKKAKKPNPQAPKTPTKKERTE